MQIDSQALPKIGSAIPLLAAGYDGGNGSIKLVIDNAEIRIPSYVQVLHGEIYNVPESKEGGVA